MAMFTAFVPATPPVLALNAELYKPSTPECATIRMSKAPTVSYQGLRRRRLPIDATSGDDGRRRLRA